MRKKHSAIQAALPPVRFISEKCGCLHRLNIRSAYLNTARLFPYKVFRQSRRRSKRCRALYVFLLPCDTSYRLPGIRRAWARIRFYWTFPHTFCTLPPLFFPMPHGLIALLLHAWLFIISPLLFSYNFPKAAAVFVWQPGSRKNVKFTRMFHLILLCRETYRIPACRVEYKGGLSVPAPALIHCLLLL